jgi:hypothetical protein
MGDVALEGVEPEPQRLGVTVDGVHAEAFGDILEVGHQRQVGEDLLQTPARHRLVGLVQGIRQVDSSPRQVGHRPVARHRAQRWA